MSAGRGTILTMSVVLLLAALAILAGVVVVAVGRGGELTIFRPDAPAHPEVFASAADVASFRPPTAFFGYSATATDDALQRIARVVAERDAEVAWLREQIALLQGSAPEPWPGAHAERGAQPEPAGWPDAWTYGGPGGRAERRSAGPEGHVGRVGEPEIAGWAGPRPMPHQSAGLSPPTGGSLRLTARMRPGLSPPTGERVAEAVGRTEDEAGAESADWREPGAYAEDEAGAESADWREPEAYAEPDRLAEPAWVFGARPVV